MWRSRTRRETTTGSDAGDATTDDIVQFEAELVAWDRNASRPSKAGIDEVTARHVVEELIDAGRVRPVPEDRVFVHEPSGSVFASIIKFAVFRDRRSVVTPPRRSRIATSNGGRNVQNFEVSRRFLP